MKLDKYKDEHKKWLEETRKLFIEKLFDLNFEERFQNCDMLLEPNKQINIGGQPMRIGIYISSLKKDIIQLENRIKLVDDCLAEFNK